MLRGNTFSLNVQICFNAKKKWKRNVILRIRNRDLLVQKFLWKQKTKPKFGPCSLQKRNSFWEYCWHVFNGILIISMKNWGALKIQLFSVISSVILSICIITSCSVQTFKSSDIRMAEFFLLLNTNNWQWEPGIFW